MEIRFVEKDELDRVTELRRQVNELHVNGKPDFFKPGFSKELRDYIKTVFNDPYRRIVVCISGDDILAFAILSYISKAETPFTFGRDYIDIDEFCVDESYRRKGIGARMIGFIRELAKTEGIDRIELNMWEFNRDALEFYEAVGFSTYRRYMELKI